MAAYVLKRRSVDDGLSHDKPVDDDDLSDMSEEDGIAREAEEAGAFLKQPSSIARMEQAAEVYTSKAKDLMNVRDPNALDRDLMVKVVSLRSQKVYGCLMLPVNLFFFTVFAASVLAHEDIFNVYAVNSGLRTTIASDLGDVETIEDIWNFLNNSLIPAAFDQTDYKGNAFQDKSDWGRVLTYNQLTGPMIIRQARSEKRRCADPDILQAGFEGGHDQVVDMLRDMVCYPHPGDESSSPFGVEVNASNYIAVPHFSEYEGGNVTWEERVAYYESSFKPLVEDEGRRLRVGRPEYSDRLAGIGSKSPIFQAMMYQNTPVSVIYEHIKYLKDRQWIDAQTKEVQAKALFLNAEVGRPRLVEFVVRMHFSRGGGIISYVTTETIFMQIWDDWKSMCADLTWCLLLFLKFGAELAHLKNKLRAGALCKTLRTGWTILQWSQVSLGVVYLMVQAYTMAILRARVVARYNEVVDQQVKDVPAEQNRFGESFHDQVQELTWLTTQFTIVTSSYLLLLFFSFFTAFQYQPRLAVVAKTLQKCAVDCVHFLIVVLPTFFGFAISGMFIFGRRLEEFSTFPQAFATCFKIMMEGEYDWPLLSEEHFNTTALWVISFMVILVILMLNMVLALVLDVYAGVRRGSGQSESIWDTVYGILLQVWNRKDWMNSDVLTKKLQEMDKWVTKQHIMAHIPQLGDTQLKLIIFATKAEKELEGAQGVQAKEAMKMALAEKLVIDKVSEMLKELADGTGSNPSNPSKQTDDQGWLGHIANQMGQRNHRMLALQWQLQKLQWQWHAMESVHGKGLSGHAEEPMDPQISETEEQDLTTETRPSTVATRRGRGGVRGARGGSPPAPDGRF